MTEPRRNAIWLGTLLSIIAASNIAASFGIQWLTVSRLGIGIQTDAFYAGATLPQILSTLVLDPLIFALVPYFSALGYQDRKTCAWFLLMGGLLLSSLAAGVIFIAAPGLMPWFVPGFSTEALNLTVELARIQSLGVIGAACFAVLACFHQSGHRFVRTALAALFCCLVGWGFLMVGLDRWGVRFAAWIQVFVLGGPALLLLPSMRPVPVLSWSDGIGHVRQLGRRVRPLVLSSAYIRSGFVVDRFLTSFLDQGSLVMLELVWRTLTALVRVLNQGIVTPILPRLTGLAVNGQWDQHRKLLLQRLCWMGGGSTLLFLAVGAAPALWVSEEVWAMWSRTLGSALGPHDLHGLWMILTCGSGILLCGGIHNMLLSAFYSEGDTSLPARIEMITSTVGLVMKAVGMMLGGLIGIALAISLFYLLNTLVLAAALARKLKSRGLPRTSMNPFPLLSAKAPPPSL
jgi:putative peptidoglycan lipid II flippase